MTIKEVSERNDISACTLRFYEKIGLIPYAQRTKEGHRNYSEEECEWILLAVSLKNIGISTDILVEHTGLFQLEKGSREIKRQILEEQDKLLQEKIAEIKKMSLNLKEKISSLK
ncbi:MerR family DNA-binding transcriptional regulator [uncultured Fusobacterium sp.]|uniref:MerR family DNA-binding transcriptional regulator n=1 Tax=uncultured Fusobacterium sp. TaxID=159267 RepID=UPI0025FED623|nr:MerR family DNA-binding transcriptional regulator [uncultured Fusobacterium sp.]